MFKQPKSEAELRIEIRKDIIKEFKDAVNCKQKIVYFAHRYGGDPENIKRVEAYIKAYIKLNPDDTPFSPLHNGGFLFGEISEQEARRQCLEWLTLCEKLVACGDWPETSFVAEEIAFAYKNRIKVEYMEAIE